MRILSALLVISLLAWANGQATNGLGGGLMSSFAGFPPSQFFQDIVIQSEAQKLLTQPDLPEDLRQRVLETVSNTETGFNNCNTAVTTLPWIQIRCVVLQLQTAKTALKAIDDEAKARAAAAAAAAAAAPTEASGSANNETV